MLRIENFTKAYTPGKPAVKDLTLTIENGDIFGFIGHNGAGKTTTIKAITGILPFEQGEITLDGISIRKDPIAFKKQIAYLPDNPDLYESMTGFKYINFIADIYRVDEKRKQQNVQKYADAFELTAELGNPISAYSHGMKQKLAIIAALVHEPKLMILDEPFVGLDPKAAHTLKGFMKELCANGGSIFFSTHVLEVAEKLCTKIAIIKNGELIRCGALEEVRGDSSLEDLFLELTE
jgi:ABC-2 type transport system ATP-binding protein